MKKGDQVTIALHPSWTAETMRLAKSGRIGTIDKLFTPLGGSPVARIMFPKQGRFKERVEYFAPCDLVIATPTTPPSPTDPRLAPTV